MSTETGTKFIVNKKDEKLNPAVGPKEISGNMILIKMRFYF